MTKLDAFTIGTFAPLVGTRFTILDAATGDAVPLTELELIEANSLGEAGHRQREPFSLLFASREPQALRDDTYRLEHERLGSFELFVVPVEQDAHGVRYEAIFS